MRNYDRLIVNNNMTGVMKFPTLENEKYIILRAHILHYLLFLFKVSVLRCGV